ncbi:alpha-mannosidase-like [Durio zibethinus]|uniref:Alpha-mannosidase n=1 Tax=Durio zibethinus TaxID=66656 RepID=A0A6P5YHT7_DURZI|nr:alpha-mannosidase-like [Durio zibethinus]
MKMRKRESCLASTFVVLVVVCSLYVKTIKGEYVKYNTGAGIAPGKLNVHLVPHSHDDVGWLKTIDQYYVGSNNSIQGACVQNVLDSVIEALLRNSNRKFVFAEMAFFQRWWTEQSLEIQEQVKKLVDAGRLEFINGGWCMHDEATAHYIDMIDQTTLGHRVIKEQFNKVPRVGWQIDPFGHSAVQGYLFGAELGFDSMHFARVDYQDRAQRKNDKTLEVIWRGSKTFGSSAQIFANAFPVHYSPPNGFEFEVDDDGVPVQDNPLLFDYNVEQRVNDFINAAMTQANVTRTNHIMWTMGDDFQYQFAESWFRQMDKLIHYVNKDGRVNALYSTPSIYTDAKNAANESWPRKTDDYFPYADSQNAYWTGYFTSRPALKRFVRMLSGYYLAARQLEFLVGKRSNGPNTFGLGDALGIVQHHDAITGTAKQHTTNDYSKRLSIGVTEAEAVVSTALSCLTKKNSGPKCEESALTFSQCQLVNISYCPPTEKDTPEGKSLVVVAYNPLAWNRTETIRIPVNHADRVVQDSSGNNIDTQYLDLDNVTRNVRDFYTKAYLGLSSDMVPKYWLLFQASVPPLGWNTYFISKGAMAFYYNGVGRGRVGIISATTTPENEKFEIGNGNLKMSFSTSSGQLQRMYNSRTGVDVPVQQSYLWYGSSTGDADPQASGAYIFRPNGAPPTVVSRSVPLKVIRGPLVDEVHQQFNEWIYQVTRLYKDKEHAEIEFTIGPIPLDDGVGKEVITRMTANMVTDKVFYTDSNGRDFLKRVRDFREDWNLTVTQPVAGNYYPINLGIYTMDKKSEFSVLVDRATGGSSIKDGEVELMLHRRMLKDDSRGVGEALDESMCVGSKCEGLTIRGNYYVSINQIGEGARWRRTTGQQVYSRLLLAFTHEKIETWTASHLTKATAMDPGYSLPLNVALITLQEMDDGSVLLRLAHLYEVGEDATYSTLAKVELKKMFNGRMIKEVKETSLTTNQVKSEMRKLSWKVEGDNGNEPSPVRGGPINTSTLVVELGPMEIRTFLLIF